MGAGHAHVLYVHEHSVVHRMPPQVKVASALIFVFLVAVTPREAVWAFGLYAVGLATLAIVSEVRLSFVALRLVGVLPFVLFAFLLPFIAAGDQIEVLGISMSHRGLWGAWNIVAKAGIGATTSILLAATTEVPDILTGLARLRVPVILTSIAGFMIRYLELIVEEIGRIRVAMRARGYEPRWLWQARPIAASAGAMFIRSYERGERVYDAMISRGFAGTMPDLRGRDPRAGDWALGAILPGLAAVVLLVAVVII